MDLVSVAVNFSLSTLKLVLAVLGCLGLWFELREKKGVRAEEASHKSSKFSFRCSRQCSWSLTSLSTAARSTCARLPAISPYPVRGGALSRNHWSLGLWST